MDQSQAMTEDVLAKFSSADSNLDSTEIQIVEADGSNPSADGDPFGGVLREAINTGSSRVVFNMENLEVLDSARIGALVMYKKIAVDRGGDLRLLRPRGRVREVLLAVNLDALFEVYELEAAAIDSFGSEPSGSYRL